MNVYNAGRHTESHELLTNLLLNGVNLARQSVADRLVDDVKDDGIQRAAGEQKLVQALTYLYCTYTPTCTQCTVAVLALQPSRHLI